MCRASVFTDAVNLPGGKRLSKGGVSGEAKGVEVTPLPGFVIKTYATDDDQVRHTKRSSLLYKSM